MVERKEEMKEEMNEELLYRDEVYKLVGMAFEVYNELKSGFLEAVYQEAFEQVLISNDVPYVREKNIIIYFRGKPLKKSYKADFVAYDSILIEFKAHAGITADDEAQVLNYLKGTRLPVALLFNFGNCRRLEWRRYAMSRKNELIEEDREKRTEGLIDAVSF